MFKELLTLSDTSFTVIAFLLIKNLHRWLFFRIAEINSA